MKIGDWPFGPPGVDCRTCLRAPCACKRPDEARFFPVVVGDLTPAELKAAGLCGASLMSPGGRFEIARCYGPAKHGRKVRHTWIPLDR